VNATLRRLAGVITVMFLMLMLAATSVQFFQAGSLNADPRNVRTLYREYGTYRGPIVVAGTPIAYSEPIDDPYGYQRLYADGPLYAPVTGFYSIVYGRSGMELAENASLNGTVDSLFLQRVDDLITGRTSQGATVELTIDPVVQQAAWDALGDQAGAVVALDPTTGAVLAMVSKPTYDPNILASHVNADVVANWTALTTDPTRPMDNRAIAGNTYPPGSVFKIITAAAAIEIGGLAADTVIPAPDELQLPLSTNTLHNYGGQRCSPTGEQTLNESFAISCNTSFAQLGMDLGAPALQQMAANFGFGRDLEIPLKVTPSYFPESLDAPQTALAAIGQYDVRVTPLQVAMVSAAIANDGVMMRPYLVSRVIDSDLTVLRETTPTQLATPISAATASVLTDMMVESVNHGTGTAARIPGVTVAGKTGTAEHGADAPPHAWFTAFAPADTPQVAVAVIVENGGDLGSEATGGAVAAPIAKAVIRAVIER
jgi:peptidoglycan glycosyltransferase